MSDDAALRRQAVEGTYLQELRAHSGWPALCGLFQGLYNEAWDELRARESPVARAKVQALEEIMQRLDDKVNLGQHARTELQRIAATGIAEP